MKFFEGDLVIESDNMRLDIRNGRMIIYSLYNDRSISLREDIYKIIENIVVTIDFDKGIKYYRPGVRLVSLKYVKEPPEVLERKMHALHLLNNHLMTQFLDNRREWYNHNESEIIEIANRTTIEEPSQITDNLVDEDKPKGM